MSNILPLGFKFSPTDNQSIKYLIHKSRDELLPCEGIISETDVFGDRPPWELFGDDHHYDDHGDVRYFFTLLKKKTKNSTKNYMKRNVGDIGTWHADSKGVPIRDPKTRKVIGNRKAYNFKLKDIHSSTSKRRRSNGDDSRWLMTEYSLDGVSLKYEKRDPDYVLCRIKKKKFLRKQLQEEEDCDSNMDDNVAADVVSGPPTTFIPPSGSNNVSYLPQSEYSTNPASNGPFQNYPQGVLPDSSAAQAIGGEDSFFDISQFLDSEQPSTGVEDMNLYESILEGFRGELLPPVGKEENTNNYNLGSWPEYCDATVQAVGGGDCNDYKVDDNQLDDQAERGNCNNTDDQTNSIGRYLAEGCVEHLAHGDGVNNVGASSSDRFSFDDTFVYIDPPWQLYLFT